MINFPRQPEHLTVFPRSLQQAFATVPNKQNRYVQSVTLT